MIDFWTTRTHLISHLVLPQTQHTTPSTVYLHTSGNVCYELGLEFNI